jgi:hypothetical protein
MLRQGRGRKAFREPLSALFVGFYARRHFASGHQLCLASADVNLVNSGVAGVLHRHIISPSMKNSFREAYLKTERANKHIHDLDGYVREFAATDRCTFLIKHDPNGGCDTLQLESTQTIPDDFLLVLGDAIHNLRSALDYAMHGASNIRDERTKFPFRDTRDELIAAINGGLKQKAPKEVIDIIVDVIQPYERGNGHALWCLHELDIEDKHRLLIANTKLMLIRGISCEDERGEKFCIPDWLIVPNATPIRRLEGHRNVKITDKGKSSLNIVFGDGMPLQGAAILPMLREMMIRVNHTVELLEASFMTSNS